MPNWSEPNIKHEKEKIDPEVFIGEAREYTEAGDFNMAERAYVNALSNARGASNVKDIARIVKNGLSEIYKLWIQDCISRYEYHEAEPVLQKLLKISDDKKTAKEEMIKLYDAWGLSLSIYDKNWKGAILIFAKKVRLEKELSLNTEITESQLCSLLYASNDSANKKKADQLHFGKTEVRIRLLISAVLMAAVALISPIFAPSSIGFYGLSVLMLPIRSDWEMLGSAAYKRKLRTWLGLTIFSLIWLFVFKAFESKVILSIITLIFVILISVRVMLYAISQFKLYFSYQKQDILDVLRDLFPPVEVSCKSCDAKLRVSGETISAVKCPKCGSVVREAVDLKIKNKPSATLDQADGGEFDPQYAWGRVGFHAGRAVAKEILRNIRF